MSNSRWFRPVRKLLLFAVLCSGLLVLPALSRKDGVHASGQVSCNECVRVCKAAGGTSMQCLAQCADSQCHS